MNIEQMKLVLAEIITKTDLTPCVVGHRGVGKTAGIIQICKELGWDYTPLRLGQMEVGDLVGIPYREGSTMHWSRPSWWPTDDDRPTIVHCDELNRAQQEDTLQAIFQFVEPPSEGRQRALHTHQLHPRHKVIVTINPPDGTYQVATLDRALIDRMVMLYVDSDYHCWAQYAARKEFDREVQGFLEGNSGLLAKAGAPIDLHVEPTERGWEMISVLRQYCRFPEALAMEVYAGIIGKEAAIAFMRWLADRSGRPVSALEILETWEDVRERVAAQRDDLQAATIQGLTTHLSVHGLKSIQEEEHLVAYIALLPRDLRFGCVKGFLRIPDVALRLAQDKYDHIIYDVMQQLHQESKGS